MERLVWLAWGRLIQLEELGRNWGFQQGEGEFPSPVSLRTCVWDRVDGPGPLEEQSIPISAGGGFCGAAEPTVCQEPSWFLSCSMAAPFLWENHRSRDLLGIAELLSGGSAQPGWTFALLHGSVWILGISQTLGTVCGHPTRALALKAAAGTARRRLHGSAFCSLGREYVEVWGVYGGFGVFVEV